MPWLDGGDDDNGKKEEELDLEKVGDYDLGEIGVLEGEGRPPEEKNVT